MLAKVASQIGCLELWPKQREVTLDLVHGSDMFISLPMASGKSLCYSLLSAVFDETHHLPGSSVVVLVSPLIALMRDQVRAMAERNVHMVYFGDTGDDVTIDEVCAQRQSDQTSIRTRLSELADCAQYY